MSYIHTAAGCTAATMSSSNTSTGGGGGGGSSNKSRVGLRLKEAIGGSKSLNKSADLTALTERYNAFVKKLQGLVVALKNQHGSLVRLQRTRTELATQIGYMTKGTPLFECAGLMPSSDRPASTVCSYASVHDGLAGKTKAYGDKFGQFVIDYAVEWEKVVTARVDKGLKTAEALRRDLDHYQKKVESLRLSANSTMSKGKQVDGKAAEKLSRNEEKFIKSKQEYNKFVADLCMLMEEVTERSWRDLHPMLIKLAQFDMTLADDEAKVLTSLSQVVNELKRLAGEHGLKAQARLKDLESLNPELLYTRPGGPLSIEASSSPTNGSAFGTSGGSSIYSTISEPMAMPPGSVAPQGMGGFPVQVASAGGDFHRNDSSYTSFPSNNSYGGGTPSSSGGIPVSTMEMLQISASAAPPPTLEQVQAANNNQMYGTNTSGNSAMTIRSAPNSGGGWSLPPLPPPTGGNYRRSGSYGDYGAGGSSDMASVSSGGYQRAGTFGGYSGGDGMSVMSAPVAPAPAAPPPPPPSSMNSPLSMYSSTLPSTTTTTSSMYSPPASEPPMYSSFGGGGGGGMDPSSMYGGPSPHQQQQYQQQQQPSWATTPTSGGGGGFNGGGMGGYGSPSAYPSNPTQPPGRQNSNPFDD